MATDLSLWLAFGAGILSFISPCTLPLFPSYLGYISGVSLHEAKSEKWTASLRIRVFLHAMAFVLGLSTLFVVLGWGATTLGAIIREYAEYIRAFGGIAVVVLGLFMAGVWESQFLSRERRLPFPARMPLGYLGSLLVGVIFAAGWTPCIGPILASVLGLVLANPHIGVWYMVSYAFGFSVPFLVFAMTLASIRPLLRYTGLVARIGGWLLVLMGLLLVTNEMKWITIWLQQTTRFNGF